MQIIHCNNLDDHIILLNEGSASLLYKFIIKFNIMLALIIMVTALVWIT